MTPHADSRGEPWTGAPISKTGVWGARQVSCACGVVVAVIGLLNVIGWHYHWSALADLFPSVLPMKFNTGLCFILCGVGVVLPWFGCSRFCVLLGALVALFMGLSVAENVSGQDFGTDGLFFQSYQHKDAFPNRVSPLTGSSFVLMGVALMLTGIGFNLRFRLAVIGIGTCAIIMIGLVAMFGYTFGIESASGWGAYTRMSVYTAPTFIVLSAGLFLWAWSAAQNTNFSFIRWLPVAGSVTLMAMISLVSAVSFVQLQNSSTWRMHTYDVLTQSQSLLRDIFDFQRAMRGYVLTGLPGNLALFDAGSKKAPKDLAVLFALTRDNAQQQANLKVLARDVSTLLAYSNKLLITRRQGLQASIQVESAGTGFALLNEALSDLQKVDAEEHRLLILRTAKANADFKNTSRLLIWGSIFAAGLLVLANILASYEVSRRRQTEDQLRVAISHQVELAEKAQAAERAKGEFLSNMSHELRTPLNAILGFAQLMELANPPPDATQSKRITQILQAGWYLLELINEVLDLAAVESGRLSLSKEAVSLPALLTTCKDMLAPQAQESGIQMNFPVFAEPTFVKADHTRLKQILINLLSNALKYNREGGIVTVDCVVHSPGRMRILIKDTGRGLPPDKVAQLFTPFNRLGQESGNVVGTGIGLVMSKRLAELMDGTLGVESTLGEGSTFWCELPLAKETKLAPENLAAGPLVTLDFLGDIGQCTVLCVEDNPANMALVEEFILRFRDVKLLTAVDGIAGIELARSALPDVILMDLNLPGISGTKALEILRQDPLTAEIPVIALSANATPRDISRGLAAGFCGYLTKPMKFKEFENTLAKALSREASKSNGQQYDHLVGYP